MPKRIFELAKDWNVMTAGLLQQAKALGIKKPTNFTSLSDAQVEKLKIALVEDKAFVSNETDELADDKPRVVRRRISSVNKAEAKPPKKVEAATTTEVEAEKEQEIKKPQPPVELEKGKPAVAPTRLTQVSTPVVARPFKRTIQKLTSSKATQPAAPATDKTVKNVRDISKPKVGFKPNKVKKWIAQPDEKRSPNEIQRKNINKIRKLRTKNKVNKHIFNPRKKEIKITGSSTINELSSQTGISANAILRTLATLGIEHSAQAFLDGETAQLIATEHGVVVTLIDENPESILAQHMGEPQNLKPRAPIVTIMGHVDHGKTSLLDQIYQTDLAEKEAGGITQQIGAYSVKTPNGQITFIDTPGHEAFTSMRARGANVTDIVVLVVAADDGVKPQTIEAINHAKSANVPILVALNKCDKEDANPDSALQELMAHDLVPEKYGGDCPVVEVSAKTKAGIADLLEVILLQAETMELTADPDSPATGRVIESKLDKSLGSLVTFLVQFGTLKVGDFVVVGEHSGKIRRMQDSAGTQIKLANPSLPVEVLGLHGLPAAGEAFQVVKNEKTGRKIVDFRHNQNISDIKFTEEPTIDSVFQNLSNKQKSKLNLVVKADTHGCLEALEQTIHNQSTAEVEIQIIHKSVGAINLSDVSLAQTSQALVVGFNVRPDAKAKKQAHLEKVNIQFYSVIYDLIKELQRLVQGLVEPVEKEEVQGKAGVQEVFNIPKIGFVAGCRVQEGKIARDSLVRVLRDNIVIHDGRLVSLRRFKDDVKEVVSGFECGLRLENYKDLRIGDTLESYTRVIVDPLS